MRNTPKDASNTPAYLLNNPIVSSPAPPRQLRPPRRRKKKGNVPTKPSPHQPLCPRPQQISPIRVPQPPTRLMHPPLLLAHLLLRLPPPVPATINLHGVGRPPPPALALRPLRLRAHDPLHHAGGAALAQLIDRTDGVDGGMQGATGVEVLLDDGEQVLALAIVAGGVVGVATGGREVGLGDEGVREGFVRGHARGGVDGQAALDELARGEGDAAPVFEGGEGVVGDEDGLHFF